jgi:hypothetical protein
VSYCVQTVACGARTGREAVRGEVAARTWKRAPSAARCCCWLAAGLRRRLRLLVTGNEIRIGMVVAFVYILC